MSDLDIGFIEIENLEVCVILTIMGWVVMYFVFGYWMDKVPNFNFWTYAIATFLLTPVATIFIIKRISDTGRIF